MGFKEIEVGFPASSAIERDFVQRLCEEKKIPRDATPRVLTQCQTNLIGNTMRSLQGLISAEGSPVKAVVIPANEELGIARKTFEY